MDDIKILIGKTFTEIKVIRGKDNKKDSIVFIVNDNEQYKLEHEQDCCEDVSINDINGNIFDLIDSPITMAEIETNGRENPEGYVPEYEQESFLWTFYKFATAKGYVTIRWYGESNGYYSEEVSFFILKDGEWDLQL